MIFSLPSHADNRQQLYLVSRTATEEHPDAPYNAETKSSTSGPNPCSQNDENASA